MDLPGRVLSLVCVSLSVVVIRELADSHPLSGLPECDLSWCYRSWAFDGDPMILACVLSFLICGAALPLLIPVLIRSHVVDLPNSRSSRNLATPRGLA